MLVCTQDTIQLTLCKPLSCDGALARHAGQSWALGATGRPQFSRCRHTILALCLEFALWSRKRSLPNYRTQEFFIVRRVGLSLYANTTAVRADERACQRHIKQVISHHCFWSPMFPKQITLISIHATLVNYNKSPKSYFTVLTSHHL